MQLEIYLHNVFKIPKYSFQLKYSEHTNTLHSTYLSITVAIPNNYLNMVFNLHKYSIQYIYSYQYIQK